MDRSYGVQIWGETLPESANLRWDTSRVCKSEVRLPTEHLSHSMAPGLSTTWHTSSSSVRQVAIPPEQNWAHFLMFCVFDGLDSTLVINQMMHKFTDHSSRRFRNQDFWWNKGPKGAFELEIVIEGVQRHVDSSEGCIPYNKPKGSDIIYGMTRHKRNSRGIFCLQSSG